MMESSSSANQTLDSLLRNPDSNLYHPPGYGDTEERKKASEDPKLLQNQSKWKLVTSFRKWRKLELNLSNNHAVLKNCNFILSCVVLAITISWAFFIMNNLATKEFFTVLLTQSAILIVLLKDTVKKYYDCIRFFYFKHPISVGDICWIEGHWMIVQEVNLLRSKFISDNNLTVELANTYLLQQQIHVVRDEDVWRQHMTLCRAV